jgi:aerobic-type carbon monoxide dehydrogenase small subunit (CoxS/CutS family)
LTHLVVNGAEREVGGPPLSSLLFALREELGITSPKAGCQQGGCGACTVLVGGEPRRACLIPLAALDGAEITTVEGLGSPESLPAQAAPSTTPRAQCGFCTSGMVRRTRSGSTIRAAPRSSGLGGQCAAAMKILEAVEAAEVQMKL